jgi:hypothetical protein
VLAREDLFSQVKRFRQPVRLVLKENGKLLEILPKRPILSRLAIRLNDSAI